MQHGSLRTEEAYLSWYLRFVRLHGLGHPAEIGKAEVGVFLTDLSPGPSLRPCWTGFMRTEKAVASSH